MSAAKKQLKQFRGWEFQSLEAATQKWRAAVSKLCGGPCRIHADDDNDMRLIMLTWGWADMAEREQKNSSNAFYIQRKRSQMFCKWTKYVELFLLRFIICPCHQKASSEDFPEHADWNNCVLGGYQFLGVYKAGRQRVFVIILGICSLYVIVWCGNFCSYA